MIYTIFYSSDLHNFVHKHEKNNYSSIIEFMLLDESALVFFQLYDSLMVLLIKGSYLNSRIFICSQFELLIKNLFVYILIT